MPGIILNVLDFLSESLGEAYDMYEVAPGPAARGGGVGGSASQAALTHGEELGGRGACKALSEFWGLSILLALGWTARRPSR